MRATQIDDSVAANAIARSAYFGAVGVAAAAAISGLILLGDVGPQRQQAADHTLPDGRPSTTLQRSPASTELTRPRTPRAGQPSVGPATPTPAGAAGAGSPSSAVSLPSRHPREPALDATPQYRPSPARPSAEARRTPRRTGAANSSPPDPTVRAAKPKKQAKPHGKRGSAGAHRHPHRASAKEHDRGSTDLAAR